MDQVVFVAMDTAKVINYLVEKKKKKVWKKVFSWERCGWLQEKKWGFNLPRRRKRTFVTFIKWICPCWSKRKFEDVQGLHEPSFHLALRFLCFLGMFDKSGWKWAFFFCHLGVVLSPYFVLLCCENWKRKSARKTLHFRDHVINKHQTTEIDDVRN